MTVFQRDEVGIVEVRTSDYDGLITGRSIHGGCDNIRYDMIRERIREQLCAMTDIRKESGDYRSI